jgi:hypothetical protein
MQNLQTSDSLDENAVFANTVILDYVNLVKVDWNYTNEDITFRITIKTSGWFGFGLSRYGKLWNANFFLVWTNPDGTVEFKDASTAHGPNIIYDSTNNWKLLGYTQTNGLTTVVVTRKNRIPAELTGTTNIDVVGFNHVIYAYGPSSVPTFHYGMNGSRPIALLSGKQ